MEQNVNIAPQAVAAEDVLRGTCRHLVERGLAPLAEFPLGNGRRADIAALGRDGEIIVVEIKVSLADFRGDRKWPEYLDYCDRFYFAVPDALPRPAFEDDDAMPERTGLIVADRFGAAILREATRVKLNAARRRAEMLRFGVKAAGRLHSAVDPDFTQPWFW